MQTGQLRADAAGRGAGAIPFEGHAIVYDSWTEVYDFWFGAFMERIQRGAAAVSMAEDDVRLLMNHDPNYVLARRRGEDTDTLRLFDDATGLVAQAEMAPTSYARDLAVVMERGDVSGMSFAFEVLAEEWSDRPDGMWMRTITELRLYDVSIVTYPAYAETDAGLRSLLQRAQAGLIPAGEIRTAAALLRAGRRNSAADEATIRSAVDGIRATADELEGLLGGEQDGTGDDGADERALRSAMAADDERHHRGLAVALGMAR